MSKILYKQFISYYSNHKKWNLLTLLFNLLWPHNIDPFSVFEYNFKHTLQLICMPVWLDIFLSKVELFLHVMHSWLKDSLKAISRKTKIDIKKSLAEKWLPYCRSCLYRNFKDSSGYKIPVYWNYPNMYSCFVLLWINKCR